MRTSLLDDVSAAQARCGDGTCSRSRDADPSSSRGGASRRAGVIGHAMPHDHVLEHPVDDPDEDDDDFDEDDEGDDDEDGDEEEVETWQVSSVRSFR